ncbi:MAG: amino acid adenylation domain-containing protein, partial [Trichodesmium sp. St2_bin2_1]|nr:amino acid adenylation domain-containing protein [Trichodesmium sp. St2_bin2_1]
MKAGGAYVPIDPTYPQERIDYMLADSGARWVLTQTAVLSQLPEGDYDTFAIDTLDVSAYGVSNPGVLMGPDHLAYVIYTSGSTGRPKGVMVEHLNIANYIFNAIELYKLSENDVVLQFSSFSFDASVEEIFPTVSVGATLKLRTDMMLSDASGFFDSIEELGVSVISIPTAYWHTLCQNKLPQKTGQLRLVIIGGEKAQAKNWANWKSSSAETIQLINTYGPTESTVIAAFFDMTNHDSPEIPIGQSIHNIQLYILDKNHQPLPQGVPGELYIAGAGLARGYLNQPELTAEKFIDNPFTPGTRLYKTGDHVRYRPDGNIEYLGRIDDQVKIRGFRIELGEIEQHLLPLHG